MRHKKRHPLSLRSEAGFSLMQVLILGGITLAMSAGTLQIMDNRAQSLKVARMANRIMMLEDKVKNAATSQNAIYFSAVHGNNGRTFQRCLSGGVCRYEAFDTYDLYNSYGDPVTGAFNANGEPCERRSTKDCPIIVDTQFQVLCAGGVTSCPQPEAIVTRYEIRQESTAFTKGFKSKPRTGEAVLVTHLCPDDKYVVGVDAAGKLVCEEARQSVYGVRCDVGAGFALNERAELRCAELVDFCSKNLSLVSVIDTSGSMQSQNKLVDAMASADSFLGKLNAADEGGLTSFDSTARSDQGLDKDKGKSRGKLRELRAFGGTNMTAGLQEAAKLLDSASAGTVQGIVFLSDGWHNVGAAPFAVADQLKAKGVKIWTIGFGESADGATLMRLASSPDNYTYAKDAVALDKIYKDIGTMMCRN